MPGRSEVRKAAVRPGRVLRGHHHRHVPGHGHPGRPPGRNRITPGGRLAGAVDLHAPGSLRRDAAQPFPGARVPDAELLEGVISEGGGTKILKRHWISKPSCLLPGPPETAFPSRFPNAGRPRIALSSGPIPVREQGFPTPRNRLPFQTNGGPHWTNPVRCDVHFPKASSPARFPLRKPRGASPAGEHGAPGHLRRILRVRPVLSDVRPAAKSARVTEKCLTGSFFQVIIDSNYQ